MKKWMYPVVTFLAAVMLTVPAYGAPFDISPSRPDGPVVREVSAPEDPAGSEKNIPGASDLKEVSPQTGESSRSTAAVFACASALGAAALLAAGKKTEC